MLKGIESAGRIGANNLIKDNVCLQKYENDEEISLLPPDIAVALVICLRSPEKGKQEGILRKLGPRTDRQTDRTNLLRRYSRDS